MLVCFPFLFPSVSPVLSDEGANYLTKPSATAFPLLKKNIYFWWLALCCFAQAFSSCSERALLFIAVWGFLIAVASPVADHRL